VYGVVHHRDLQVAGTAEPVPLLGNRGKDRAEASFPDEACRQWPAAVPVAGSSLMPAAWLKNFAYAIDSPVALCGSWLYT
jgi:hypothetical protein